MGVYEPQFDDDEIEGSSIPPPDSLPSDFHRSLDNPAYGRSPFYGKEELLSFLVSSVDSVSSIHTTDPNDSIAWWLHTTKAHIPNSVRQRHTNHK